jgi:hypothetical protein
LVIFTLSTLASNLPLRELWFVLGALLTAGGIIVVVLEKHIRKAERERQALAHNNIRRILEKGVLFLLSPADFEIKTQTWYPDPYAASTTRLQAIDAVTAPVYPVQKSIEYSYLLYRKEMNGTLCTFVSPPIPMTVLTLTQTIDSLGQVKLYVLPEQPRCYHFELPFLR